VCSGLPGIPLSVSRATPRAAPRAETGSWQGGRWPSKRPLGKNGYGVIGFYRNVLRPTMVGASRFLQGAPTSSVRPIILLSGNTVPPWKTAEQSCHDRMTTWRSASQTNFHTDTTMLRVQNQVRPKVVTSPRQGLPTGLVTNSETGLSGFTGKSLRPMISIGGLGGSLSPNAFPTTTHNSPTRGYPT